MWLFGCQSGLHVSENKLVPLPGVEPIFLAHPVRTLVTVLTALSWLLGGTEYNHERLEQGHPVSGSKFETNFTNWSTANSVSVCFCILKVDWNL